MMIFADGTCPKCGGHTYNRQGGPLTCPKCGWTADLKTWEDDMRRVMDTLGKTIDTFLANYEEATLGDDRAAVCVPVHGPRSEAAGQRRAWNQSGDM